MSMVERISATFGVNAHEWLHESPQPTSPDASASEPRVVHMKPEALHGDREEGHWRGKAIDLLSRMTDLLESLIKNARGGGNLFQHDHKMPVKHEAPGLTEGFT